MGNPWDNKATSPQFTTSVTTDSTTFNLLNNTMTTLSAFGEATRMHMGASGGRIIIGGAADISSSYSLIVKGWVAFNNDRSTGGYSRNWGIHTNNTTEGSLEFYCGASEGADPSDVKMAISKDGALGIGSVTIGPSGVTSSDRGTVTQQTSLTTDVTINKLQGTITTYNGPFTSNTGYIFNVNNSTVSSSDVILCTTQHYGGSQNFTAEAFEVSSGQFSIRISAYGATTTSVEINFKVFKTE